MRISPPNYTQTPNVLFDHWLPFLGEGELKVLLVIMRKTYGWHQDEDRISLSQLEKFTGLTQTNIGVATKSLISKGLISKRVEGPNGKQSTYYSLVVEEDSNNSYPSCNGRDTPPATGGTPLLQRETQNKDFKETEEKQQQQPAAAPFQEIFQKQPEPPRPEIPQCLQDIDIPETEKFWLCNHFPLERIEHAVEWTKKTKDKIQCLPAALKWACNFLPEIPIPKEDIVETNKAYAQHYDGLENETSRITACHEYVEISQKATANVFTADYDDKAFKDLFEKALIRAKFEIFKKEKDHEK